MDALQIKAFIDAMATSDLAEMEATHEGWTLRLVRRPGAAATPKAEPAAAAAGELAAPMFGVLHLQPSPGAPAFVSVGQAVRAGQTVAVIEAMKVFNEVAADRDGVVDALLVGTGTEVEAGQPLIRWR